MTIGLTWRRTARRIKRLKETVLAISPDYSIAPTPDFLALSNHWGQHTNWTGSGRSVKGLVDLVNELENQKVHFPSITDGIDTKTPAGCFFFHVMASLAQMERELIMERTRAGLEAARRYRWVPASSRT